MNKIVFRYLSGRVFQRLNCLFSKFSLKYQPRFRLNYIILNLGLKVNRINKKYYKLRKIKNFGNFVVCMKNKICPSGQIVREAAYAAAAAKLERMWRLWSLPGMCRLRTPQVMRNFQKLRIMRRRRRMRGYRKDKKTAKLQLCVPCRENISIIFLASNIF